MSQRIWVATGVALALSGGPAFSGELAVTGQSARGNPGNQVFVELAYDFASGLSVTVEDLYIDYRADGIAFSPGATTIDLGGTTRPLNQYVDELKSFAQINGGSVLVNVDPRGPDYPRHKGYALSYLTDGTVGQWRAGLVHLNLAFEIAVDAKPGFYQVIFPAPSGLVDDFGNEYIYPESVMQLGVAVVPEPQTWLTLLVGVGFVGALARRLGNA